MNTIIEHLVFTAIASMLYLPARWAKRLYSGRNHSKTKYRIFASYNFALACMYLDFIQTRRIPFYGEMHTIILELLATLMILLHITSFPQEQKVRPWRFKKRFNFKIRKHKLALRQYRKAQQNKDQ